MGKLAMKHRPDDALLEKQMAQQKRVGDDTVDVIAEDVVADDSIFDWERHLDDTTGRVFYYNVKTQESRWTPPTVKVHEQHKIADRTSKDVKQLYSPKPPDTPKATLKDDEDTDRVKKG